MLLSNIGIPLVFIYEETIFVAFTATFKNHCMKSQELLSLQQPPEAVPQPLFVCLPFALFKAEDLQKEHSSGPKYLWAGPSTGTGSEARITSRERDTYCLSEPRKGCDNVEE